MPKILIMTSVVGGGHVFRDIAIAKELKKLLPENYEIIFASGGNAYAMIQDEGLKVEKITGLNFPAHQGTASFLKLYLAILWSELLQLFDLRRLIKKHQPALVILDEFFFIADYCRLHRIPVVFMCDFVGVPQLRFFHNPLRATIEKFFDWYLASYLPRRVNRWIYIGDTQLIPHEDWRARTKTRGIVTVEPITKVQHTPPPTKDEARKKLGFTENERVVTVAVGCSGVGEYLLETANAAALLLHNHVPGLRIELICGNGIDPKRILGNQKVRLHGYTRDIEVFFAASDAVIVQCGLTTTTECLMIGVPMIVVPLADHWEQSNTARYLYEKAGVRKIDAEYVSPEVLSDAILQLLNHSSQSVSPFRGDGHIVAAQAIADVLDVPSEAVPSLL